jgi:hypothetical protein
MMASSTAAIADSTPAPSGMPPWKWRAWIEPTPSSTMSNRSGRGPAPIAIADVLSPRHSTTSGPSSRSRARR